jgi:DNA polymerase III alpha subunit
MIERDRSGTYAELHCHSYFSLLDGASSPEALVERAAALGYPALALTDHNGLYGAVHHRRGGHTGGRGGWRGLPARIRQPVRAGKRSWRPY